MGLGSYLGLGGYCFKVLEFAVLKLHKTQRVHVAV